jgi:hypothetical protein
MNMQVNQTNNTLVITAEQAAHFKERNAVLDKELDEIEKTYNSKRGSANGRAEMLGAAHEVREVEAESSLVENTAAIQLPPASGRTSGWWKTLSSGSGERPIAAAAAKYALRVIATEVLGGARGSGLVVDWEETPTLSELWSAIRESCGEAGWQALVKRGAEHPQEAPPGSAGRVASS